MLSVFDTIVSTFGLTSDKWFMGDFLYDEFQELGSADTDCTTGSGNECTGAGDEDRPFVAVRDTESLPIQFRVKGCASFREGLP